MPSGIRVLIGDGASGPNHTYEHSIEWLMQEGADLRLPLSIREMLLRERVLKRTGVDIQRAGE